ncbi:GIY-YIG nuclease family protein [Chryseobacterium lactis]|uniref:GIY-YIG nuclease family protein n=1 Tax=Chryseobacterium lactis TaxID=1241981 RepID=UPI001623B30C|nr:GIY-YIG nuclease family protein [Chryseobacterium lactis]
MSRGITITNYLVNGNPEGITMSYVSNWTGQAIKIPRNAFFDTKEFEELNKPGIYYLIGQKDENPDEILVYVGEANHLFDRIKQHMKDTDKSFCELIIAFSSKDDNMTVSHTKYLESKILTEIFEKSGYKIINKKDGNRISLPKMVRDEMDIYFDNMKILLPTMGYDLFKPIMKEQKQSLTSKEEKLILEVGDIKAQAKLITNGLLVLKGSLMKTLPTPALAPTYLKIRNDLVQKGYVRESTIGLEFLQDYEFPSPSQAGAVILGYSVNGRVAWKNSKGKTLKEIEEEKIDHSI